MCSNTNTENMVNKLLGFCGFKKIDQVGKSQPKAEEDKALLDSFLSHVEREAHRQKVAEPRDNTRVSVAKADLQSIKVAKNELATLLNDLFSNKDKFMDSHFFLPHVQQALKKLDVIHKYNI